MQHDIRPCARHEGSRVGVLRSCSGEYAGAAVVGRTSHRIEVEVADGDSLVVLHGPLDRVAAARLARVVRRVHHGGGDVVVDLGDVSRASRRGVRSLASLAHEEHAAGGRLRVRAVREPVLRLVEDPVLDACCEASWGPWIDRGTDTYARARSGGSSGPAPARSGGGVDAVPRRH
jgi:anti-anti-sigma regulatory factor